MVTIVDFEKRKNEQDEEFNVLILQGGVEAIISHQSGKPYITARKTSMRSLGQVRSSSWAIRTSTLVTLQILKKR